jgi:hypothetical protein
MPKCSVIGNWSMMGQSTLVGFSLFFFLFLGAKFPKTWMFPFFERKIWQIFKKKKKNLWPHFDSDFNLITFWNDETLENSITQNTQQKKKEGTKKDEPSPSQVFDTCLDRF